MDREVFDNILDKRAELDPDSSDNSDNQYDRARNKSNQSKNSKGNTLEDDWELIDKSELLLSKLKYRWRKLRWHNLIKI